MINTQCSGASDGAHVVASSYTKVPVTMSQSRLMPVLLLLFTSSKDDTTNTAIQQFVYPVFAEHTVMLDWARMKLKAYAKKTFTHQIHRHKSYGIDESWLHDVLLPHLEDRHKLGNDVGLRF